MCGICGFYNFNKDRLVDKSVLTEMMEVLKHRGPDDNNIYIDRFIGLAHTRLSIIDIKNGRQPMCNENETIWVTYNGEIYNFQEVKSELLLKGHRFSTNCDTEVIVHSYEEYGYDCVSKFNGMFAFAIWDGNDETLFLARDRIGIKPLYYTISEGVFAFASEIKALLKHPQIKTEANINSIPEYFFCTTLLEDKTMFKDIYSIPPGYYIVFKDKNKLLKQYWDVPIKDAYNDRPEEYTSKIIDILKSSVSMQMMSDVSFGTLLSGGLDSSLITALATQLTSSKLSTFSMEYSQNVNLKDTDIKYARLMAELFDTNHNECIFHPDDYQNVMEKTTWHVEKPVELTAPSLYLLFRFIKNKSTVVLSGEGADELFGGYFFFLENAQKQKGNLSEFPWSPYFKEVSMILDPDLEKETRFRERVDSTIYDMMNKFSSNDYMNKVLYIFIKFYLVEMVERQDKTSMAFGIEARVPFLDHRLVEYVANIPFDYKLRNGEEKYILKQSSAGILPQDIVQRKKKPLPFPVDPKSIYVQRNIANELVQNSNSKISYLFDKKSTNDFFNRKGKFINVDSLAIFRTSYALIALEKWYKVFGG